MKKTTAILPVVGIALAAIAGCSSDDETDRILEARLDPEDLERFERRFGYHPCDKGGVDLATIASTADAVDA